MAYSEEQLRNIKIAALKRMATALKKQMNIGVGITRFAKDNLISFILEHQTEDFEYADIGDESDEEAAALETDYAIDKSGGRDGGSPEKKREQKTAAQIPLEAGIVSGEAAEKSAGKPDAAVKTANQRIKRLRNKNDRQIKAAAADQEEKNNKAIEVIPERKTDSSGTAKAAEIQMVNERKTKKGHNKRQCASVPLVDKDNEPVGSADLAARQNSGSGYAEQENVKLGKLAEAPGEVRDGRLRKESKRISPKTMRGEPAGGSRPSRSRVYEEREDTRYYEEKMPRSDYERDDEAVDADGYWEHDDSRYYEDEAYQSAAYNRDEDTVRAYGERFARGARREAGDLYARPARDFEDERYERGRSSRYARSEAYDDYEDAVSEPQLEAFVTGILEIKPDGAGMLRGVTFKECDNNDVFVSNSIIKGCGLRVGDMVTGMLRAPRREDNFFSLHKVIYVNGQELNQAKRRPVFDQLIPIYPNQRYVLEHDPNELTTRIIDLFAPLGRGQRCLIVAPPKAGKTIMLKNIAMGISANCPEAVLMALLVDERPEEVTDMIRSIDGIVVASTFDEAFEQHIRISKLVLERARRLVEMGKDVVIIMDSLTRLGRACNNCAPTTGRTMSGGLDISALRVPKHLFGSARNIENGGSLTIIATALIETGSKMDEVIFEEFKGTGNMEVNLSRKLAERRIFPAIDLCRSGTRHDELLYDIKGDEMWFATTIRQQLSTNIPNENDYKQVEPVIKTMKPHPTNAEYVARMKSQRSE